MAQEFALAIELADGRTIVAQPGPEDQGRLANVTLSGQTTVQLGENLADTEGHQSSNELAVDVEGHVMTLRLPNSADAAALRRLLLAGTLTATVVAASAAAALQGSTNSPAPAAVPAQQVVSAPAVDLAMQREQRLAEVEAVPANAAGTSGAQDAPNSDVPDSRETRSGPLEFDR